MSSLLSPSLCISEDLALAQAATEDVNVLAFEVEARAYERRAALLCDLSVLISSGAWPSARKVFLGFPGGRYTVVGEEDGFPLLWRKGEVFTTTHAATRARLWARRVFGLAPFSLSILFAWLLLLALPLGWWPVIALVWGTLGAYLPACTSLVDLEKKPHPRFSIYAQVRVLERAVAAGMGILASRREALARLNALVAAPSDPASPVPG